MSGWWDTLTLVHSAERGHYEWDRIEVRYDREKDLFFWDEQCGCSCYWWENPTGPDEVQYGTREQAAKAARAFSETDYEGEPTPDDAAAAYREVRTWKP